MADGETKRRKKARRTRSAHPGVVLAARTLPSGGTSYRARYTDPRTGRVVWETLPPEIANRDARTTWARNKADELARQRLATTAELVDAGLDGAIKAFLERPRQRERTIATHRAALEKLGEWAKRSGVRTTAQLTRPKLAAFRDEIVKATKRAPVAGGGRGEKAASGDLRSPFTVNRELASIRAALNFWRKRGETDLGRDEILETLALVELPREDPDYLAAAALRKLLDACVRHDAARFGATREELAGERPAGSTAKHLPIAPAVALILLSGMRRGEALGLRWQDVDLDALDQQGRPVGEIRLTAAMTKTKRARTIGLEVSPALRRLLGALRLRHGGRGHVLGGEVPYSAEILRLGAERLVSEYAAPRFSWQLLRSTTATYLTNATGIYGGASVFLSARQLGHSVPVAERHYLDVIRGIPREAKSLEAAMQIESELAAILDGMLGAPVVRRRRRRVRR